MVVNRNLFIQIIGMVFLNEIGLLEEGRYVKLARGF